MGRCGGGPVAPGPVGWWRTGPAAPLAVRSAACAPAPPAAPLRLPKRGSRRLRMEPAAVCPVLGASTCPADPALAGRSASGPCPSAPRVRGRARLGTARRGGANARARARANERRFAFRALGLEQCGWPRRVYGTPRLREATPRRRSSRGPARSLRSGASGAVAPAGKLATAGKLMRGPSRRPSRTAGRRLRLSFLRLGPPCQL